MASVLKFPSPAENSGAGPGRMTPTLRRWVLIWILATPGIDGRQDEAVGVLLGDLVRFLLGLVEANQTAVLAMKATTDQSVRCASILRLGSRAAFAALVMFHPPLSEGSSERPRSKRVAVLP